MTTLNIGDQAPAFEGENQDGEIISLNQYHGKKVILYFYPKDNTPGCTAESCNLNDNYNMWLSKGYEVIGISPDGVKSHKRFSEKHGFAFNLIADPEKKILESYGVWALKKMYGREYMGVVRTTFIISEDGKIEQIFLKVKTKAHTEQILETISE